MFLSFFLYNNFAWAKESPIIFITAFSKLPNSLVENASGPIAVKLIARLKESNIDSRLCLIPTNFEASNHALNCFNQHNEKPDLVLSLGVSRSRISLETTYRSDKHSKQIIRATFPFEDIFKALYGEDHYEGFVRLSSDAGGWICDITAYNLSLKMNSLNIPYGFIHVPSFYRNQESQQQVVNSTANELFNIINHYIYR